MERDQRDEPITLNYASVQSKRRFKLIDIMLILLFVSVVTAFVLRPRLMAAPPFDGIDLTRANMHGLTSPLELYRLKAGVYPASLDDLYQLPRGMTQEAWGGPYLDNADKLKDVWGRPLRYKAPGVRNPKWYDLWSTGKDGLSGTKDDLKNW